MPRVRLFGVWLGSLVMSAAGGAQQAPAAMVGVAIDSLRGGPLSGAIVMVVDGATRQAGTDSAGRFRIDSIPPGAHRIAVFHPLLDTLDVSLVLPAIIFNSGQTVTAVVATPSAPTLLHRFCPEEGENPTLILGHVLVAGNDGPVDSATVTLNWQKSVRTTASDANGRFRLCAPPGIAQGVLRATRGHSATGSVPLQLPPGTVTLPVLHLAAETDTSRGMAVAQGRVVGAGGRPISGAIVTMAGTAARAETRENGSFTLTGLPVGTQTLFVSAIGYAATTLPINLTVGAPWSGVIRLTAAPTLSTVEVSADRSAPGYAKVGFTQRQHGGIGTFMTTADIERKQPSTTTDVFNNVPGIYVDRSQNPPLLVGGRGMTSLKAASGSCINLFVDGHHIIPPPRVDSLGSAAEAYTPLNIDEHVSLTEIAAVEVYNTGEIPSRFQVSGESCQVIVVWTKSMITESSSP